VSIHPEGIGDGAEALVGWRGIPRPSSSNPPPSSSIIIHLITKSKFLVWKECTYVNHHCRSYAQWDIQPSKAQQRRQPHPRIDASISSSSRFPFFASWLVRPNPSSSSCQGIERVAPPPLRGPGPGGRGAGGGGVRARRGARGAGLHAAGPPHRPHGPPVRPAAPGPSPPPP